jgi:hypothetical protein
MTESGAPEKTEELLASKQSLSKTPEALLSSKQSFANVRNSVRASFRASVKASFGPSIPLAKYQEPDEKGEEHGLTIVGCGLAIVSTIIGGGIVGLPYAFLLLGLVAGFALLAYAIWSTWYSAYIYFALRDTVPGKLGSLYEICFVIQGRKSIFILASVYFFVSTGAMLIYFIVFGDTCATLFGSIFNPTNPTEYIYG